MTAPAKLGLGVLSLGSATGIAYAWSTYFSDSKAIKSEPQKTSISSLIEKEYEYILLNTEGNTDNTHWTTNWNQYKNDYTSKPSDLFNLNGWETLKGGDDASELKKKCNELASKKVLDKDDQLYENMGKYCGRSVTIEDEATKNRFTILKTDASATGTTGVGAIWKKRHTDTNNLKNEFIKLEIKQPTPSEADIRTVCGTAKAKSKKETNYQEIYKAYVKVCTKQPGETIT